jgi:CheY-like chemotaxis protein
VLSSPHPTVLLVDDSADTSEMYAVGLALAGYLPLTAADQESAFTQIQGQHLDVVVTDLRLPGRRDGWQLIEALKRNPSTRHIPVVVLTGDVDSSLEADAAKAGCAAVLTKPCLPEDLADVLQRIVPASSNRNAHEH